MKYFGVDITQHREFCLSTILQDQTFLFAGEKRALSVPSAILPEYPGETPVHSSDDPHNRRGLGLLWPRDAQVPVGGTDWNNGVGRVPLLACLSNIKAEGDAEEWKYIDSKISWKPHAGGRELTFSNASILSRLFDKIDGKNERSCFVIPEGFGESAQQTLLEELPEKTLLIPRSIAIALKWCREHNTEYRHIRSSSKGEPIGHLLCCSLGLGEWEVSMVEIRAVRYETETWLVPIHDPTLTGQGLNFCGMALCPEMVQAKPGSPVYSIVWKNLFHTPWFNSLTNDKIILEDDVKTRLSWILNNPSSTSLPYNKLAIMKGLSSRHQPRESVVSLITRSISAQTAQLAGFNKIIGIAAGGSFAKIPLSGQQTIAKHLLSKVSYSLTPEIFHSSVFAEGAAMAAYCIAHNLPCYQTKLIPLDLYTIERNEFGDKTERWEPLISEGTIPAGKIYKQPEAITGLSIPDGYEHLELTLRRPCKDLSLMYRSVTAKITEKTRRREPVEIHANVRPGQGFAIVKVDSARKGVFSSRLDWRTMKTASKPELKLEYIPKVAYIVSDPDMWAETRQAMNNFIYASKSGKSVDDCAEEVLKQMRRWRLDRTSSDIFRHVGPLNNDGNVAQCPDNELIMRFSEILVKEWKVNRLRAKLYKRLLRIGGWLYMFIPKEMLDFAIQKIRSGAPVSQHLAVAGLSLHTDEQLQIFYRAFHAQHDPNSEWYRTLRNLIRFRDAALSKDVITNEQVDRILERLIDNLYSFSRSDSPRKYYNSIEVLVYFLKRRRYDENFLNAEDGRTALLHELLHKIASETKYQYDRQFQKYRRIAEAALSFLDKKATSANLAAILEADEGEEDDD